MMASLFLSAGGRHGTVRRITQVRYKRKSTKEEFIPFSNVNSYAWGPSTPAKAVGHAIPAPEGCTDEELDNIVEQAFPNSKLTRVDKPPSDAPDTQREAEEEFKEMKEALFKNEALDSLQDRVMAGAVDTVPPKKTLPAPSQALPESFSPALRRLKIQHMHDQLTRSRAHRIPPLAKSETLEAARLY
eukprot:Sspe_Gene.118509::Locus_112139_Transcript_1_4_Confidence_0.333_Length_631::g.118509::m.118509